MQKTFMIPGVFIAAVLANACTQTVYKTEYVEVPVAVESYNPRVQELIDQLEYVKDALLSIEKKIATARGRERIQLKKMREILFVKQLKLFNRLGTFEDQE